MDASKSHFIGLILASIVIVLFAVLATIVIVTWSPILPEAVAVDMSRNTSSDFSSYIALHQAESWHYLAVLHDPIAHCAK